MAQNPSIRPSDLLSNIMFFSQDLLDGGIPNLTDLLQRSVAGVFDETDQFFRFRINPSLLKVGKKKITSLTLTGLGYERSHHGNELARLSYAGTTGYLRPPNLIETTLSLATLPASQRATEVAKRILNGSIDISQSPVYKKFRQFEQFVDRMDREVVMFFDLRLFTGMLTSFDYTEDANDPLQIKYSFSFEAHTDLHSGVANRLGGALVDLGGP